MTHNRHSVSSALEQIARTVEAAQIPDLSLMKSLISRHEREMKIQQNDLLTKMQDCIRRGEVAARRLYQRHTEQPLMQDIPPALQPRLSKSQEE